MKMSKSLKVFESSIIRSEKLFNLISQVGVGTSMLMILIRLSSSTLLKHFSCLLVKKQPHSTLWCFSTPPPTVSPTFTRWPPGDKVAVKQISLLSPAKDISHVRGWLGQMSPTCPWPLSSLCWNGRRFLDQLTIGQYYNQWPGHSLQFLVLNRTAVACVPDNSGDNGCGPSTGHNPW